MPREGPRVGCARCGGARPAGLRRSISIVGEDKTKSVATCTSCKTFCPQTTPGPEPLKNWQCERRTGHPHPLCHNLLGKAWKRGDDAAHQQASLDDQHALTPTLPA